MLAPNYKTATELGISEKLHGALILVKGMLERDEIVHATRDYDVDDYPLPEAAPEVWKFNMSDWRTKVTFAGGPCGSVACIGGSCEWLLKERLSDADEDRAMELFYPHEVGSSSNWSEITPAQAARAIGNFLTTGEPKWREAVAG